MSYYREQLESWLKTINVNADKILDIGGGEKPIKDRVASWNVKDYKILDNDVQFKPDILADLNYHYDPELLKNSVPFQKYFDVVFCLEVMEYIWSPLQAHKTIYDFLKPDGIAYISYPSQYPLHEPKEIDSLRYTKYGIEKLLKESGFAKWEIIPRVATAGVYSLNDFYRLEGMHPVRHDDAIFDIGYMVKAYKNE